MADAFSSASSDSFEDLGDEAVLAASARPLITGLPAELVEAVHPDDAASIATVESQWLLVETEEGDPLGDIAADEKAEEAPEDSGTAAEESPEVSDLCAALDRCAPLQLGSPLLVECEGRCGDVSAQWAPAFEHFPHVSGAFRLGCVSVSPAAHGASGVLAVSRVVVRNTGAFPWPAQTALRIVAGDACGFDSLRVGALAPGHAAELVLDLSLIPVDAAGPLCVGCGRRSAWVLEDGRGEPFGPLLVLEAMWTYVG